MALRGKHWDGPLAAASSGAVGGLTAMGLWELTPAPGVVAALAAALAGAGVFATGTVIDRLLAEPMGGDG